MGTFILKHIDMTLDPESIDKAIQQIEELQTDIQTAMVKLCEYLMETGVEVAKIHLMAHDRSGALRDSIHHGAFDVSSGVGIISAGEGLSTKYGSYAMFVEYGTGLVGSETAPPHANGYAYDVNGHGASGWVYYDDYYGQFVWTKGYPPHPFMYNTLLELADIAERDGGQILATYIPSAR